MRAGDRFRAALEPGCVYPNKGTRRDANASAARAALTPGRRAHRAFYWPFGCKNRLWPRASEILFKRVPCV